MKLFKVKLESRHKSTILDDFYEPLYVVAESLTEVIKEYPDILEASLFSNDVKVIDTAKTK